MGGLSLSVAAILLISSYHTQVFGVLYHSRLSQQGSKMDRNPGVEMDDQKVLLDLL